MELQTDLAPIVIFSYNRPHYLRETLMALEKNEESRKSRLYIYCDGPPVNADKSAISKIHESRKVAKEKQWCADVLIIERDINLGLSQSIISGINEIFKKHEKIIVLEDDLVTSPHFLNYMNKALKLYEDIDKVISVVGYNYPLKFEDYEKQTYFLKNADCLGWGTWKRGWSLFEENASVLINTIEKNGLVKEFNFDNQYPFMKMLKAVATGNVNSWAIRWYGSSFVNDKLTLFPKRSLVKHIGNEGTNIKVDNSDILGSDISFEPVTYFETEVVENKESRLKLACHFKKYNRRKLTISNLLYAYKRFIAKHIKCIISFFFFWGMVFR